MKSQPLRDALICSITFNEWGFPKGSVIRPSLFLSPVNDTPENIISTFPLLQTTLICTWQQDIRASLLKLKLTLLKLELFVLESIHILSIVDIYELSYFFWTGTPRPVRRSLYPLDSVYGKGLYYICIFNLIFRSLAAPSLNCSVLIHVSLNP